MFKSKEEEKEKNKHNTMWGKNAEKERGRVGEVQRLHERIAEPLMSSGRLQTAIDNLTIRSRTELPLKNPSPILAPVV